LPVPSAAKHNRRHLATLDSNALDNTQPLSSVKNPGQYPDTNTRRTPWTTTKHHHNALDNTTIPPLAQHPPQHAATITTPSTTLAYNHQPRQHPATITSRTPSTTPSHYHQSKTIGSTQIQSSAEHHRQHPATITTPSTTARCNH